MNSYYEAQQARLQARRDGMLQERQREDRRRIASAPLRDFGVVAFVIGSVMLWVVYYYVLNRNKLVFSVLVIVLVIALFSALGQSVKEDGAAVAGGFVP